MIKNEVVLAFSNQGITYFNGEELEIVSKHPIHEKNVSYDNFIDILNSSTKISFSDVSGANVPLPVGAVFFDYRSNDTNTGIDIDRKIVGILVRKKRAILLFCDKPLEIAIPNILFTFSIDKGRYSVHVNVVLDEDLEACPFVDNVTLKGDYKVYPSIFPNSYSDGRVCWGNTALPKFITESSDYCEVIKSYFISSFNDDLLDIDRIDVMYLLEKYYPDVSNNRDMQSSAIYELFLKTLSELDSFDDELINRIKFFKYNDWILLINLP